MLEAGIDAVAVGLADEVAAFGATIASYSTKTD
jgi:hypothetical protein